MSSFFGVMFVLFFSFSYFCLFIQAAVLRSIVVPRQPHAGTEQLSVVVASFLFFCYFFCSLEMSLFPSIFIPFPFLYGEYVVRFSLPDGVFPPCDHGLNFWHQLICENSINQSNQSQRVSNTLKKLCPNVCLNIYCILLKEILHLCLSSYTIYTILYIPGPGETLLTQVHINVLSLQLCQPKMPMPMALEGVLYLLFSPFYLFTSPQKARGKNCPVTFYSRGPDYQTTGTPRTPFRCFLEDEQHAINSPPSSSKRVAVRRSPSYIVHRTSYIVHRTSYIVR